MQAESLKASTGRNSYLKVKAALQVFLVCCIRRIREAHRGAVHQDGRELTKLNTGENSYGDL
jgi:hypothetical protein